MKKSLSILFIVFICNSFTNKIVAQTVTTTISYTGFIGCGGCAVCGADYWCFNTLSSYCGNTTACGTQTFTDPVPAGNIVTNISISYYSAGCSGGALTSTINGNVFPTVNEPNNGCACSSSPCNVAATTGSVFPCGVPGYVYGGVNNLQLCTGADVCINKIILTMTYAPANQASPALQPGAISGSTAICAGTPYNYSIPAVSNASSYTWTVPAGWIINSGQGTTSISATPGGSGNVCVTASNLCGTSVPTCLPVTLNTPSTAPTGASVTPTPICSGTSSTLSVSGGSLGTGASWNWYTGSCGGSFVGSGASISVSPSSTTTYYVLAQGACNTTSCVSTTLTVSAPPTPANAGIDQSICGTVATFTGNVPVNGTGTWTLISGTGTITSPNSSTSGVTGLSLGANVFQWTISNPPCTSTSDQVTITVNPDASISLTSAVGTNGQTLCINTAITNITYTIGGGGTGAGVTGLPTGVTGSYSGGTFTISGTPSVTGTFNYTVTTTGTCAQVIATGTITINPDATINLSSAVGTDGQTLCVNTAITNITYTIGGGGTGAGVTGLPTGVTGSYSGGTFTISGTPSVTGTFNYTVTTTGTCAQVIATGTITINPDATINLSSAVGTDGQTLCVNTAITNITYTIGGGGTGAGVTGLPTGVTGSYSAGIFIINGSPSVTGTFNYTVTTTGTCAQVIATGTITINPDATINLSSAVGTDGQTLCVNTAIINITYTIGGGGTGAGVTGLPTGVTGSYNAGIFTISGIPSVTGTFNYMVTTTGTCTQISATGTIIINPIDTPSFNYSSPSYCITGTNPTPTITGTTGGTFTISGSGVINSTTGVINLGASGLGTYTIIYNTASAGNPCPAIDSTTITITSAPGAAFTYNTPFCQSDTLNPLPIIGGTSISGVFTSSPLGVNFVDTLTGEINLGLSTAGTYMIYNYVAAASGCAAAIDSLQITINLMYTTPQIASICQGDSIILGGAYQTMAGAYNDTLTTINGCDSIITTTLTINSVPTNLQAQIICQGDSIMLGGTFQTTAGVYNDTLATINGCDSIIITTLTITPLNSIVAQNDTTICLGDALSLGAIGSGNGTITWYSDAQGTNVLGTGSAFIPVISGVGTQVYYVNEAGLCASNMDSVVVIVGGVTAIINATPVTGMIPLNVFFGNGSTTGSGISYAWNFGDGNVSNQFEPSNLYASMGSYIATLVVTDGICYDTAIVTIDVFGKSSVIIPNVFTPNGDGSNDVFMVGGTNLESVEAEIYNRWGEKMYSWSNVKGYWDGTTLSGSKVADGTYFYIIKAKGIDGQEYFKKGGVTLIR